MVTPRWVTVPPPASKTSAQRPLSLHVSLPVSLSPCFFIGADVCPSTWSPGVRRQCPSALSVLTADRQQRPRAASWHSWCLSLFILVILKLFVCKGVTTPSHSARVLPLTMVNVMLGLLLMTYTAKVFTPLDLFPHAVPLQSQTSIHFIDTTQSCKLYEVLKHFHTMEMCGLHL